MRPGACDVKQSLLGMKHSWTSALILNRTALSQVASAISVLLRPWMRRISFSVTSAAGGCFTCLHCWRRLGMCITTPYEWHLVWLYNFFSLQLLHSANWGWCVRVLDYEWILQILPSFLSLGDPFWHHLEFFCQFAGGTEENENKVTTTHSGTSSQALQVHWAAGPV